MDGDLSSVFSYEYMTRVIQKFKFPEYWFVNMVPDEPIDGVVAEWDIDKQQIEIDTSFVDTTGSAEPLRSGDLGNRVQKMPITFKFMTLDPNKLYQLRELGSNRQKSSGRSYIMRNQKNMQWRLGAYLDEYLLSQALTGTLTITVNGVSTSIDYEVPASHKPSAAAAWSTTTTNVLTDLTNWKRLIVKDTGMTPRYAVCNQTVMNYLIRNADVQAYIGSTGAGVQIAENGYLVRFFGLTWVVLDHHYASAGATEAFNTPFIADNKLFLLPDFDQDWIAMQRGTIIRPDNSLTDYIEQRGPVMWSRSTDNPTGVTLYYKNARLPVIRNPKAIVYASVT